MRRNAKLLAILNGFFEGCTVYDSQGQKWRTKGIEPPRRRSWWMLLLANTVYNPRVEVAVIWRQPEPYALEELKLIYIEAVERDDDILTQFVAADELKRRISQAQSFDKLAEIYNWTGDDEGDENKS